MEREPLFSRHREQEHLEYQNYGLLKLQSPCTQDGETFGKQKIVSYDDDKAGTFASAFMFTGTMFVNRQNWTTCACYWIISAAVTGLIVWYREGTNTNLHPLESPKQTYALGELTTYFAALVAFLTGLFVATMLQRWWNMRTHLCRLFNSIHDLMSRVGQRMFDPDDHAFTLRMLRLCLLSTRLVFDEARGEETKVDLQAHVDAGLLHPDELAALVERPGKSIIVWTWVQSFFNMLCKQNKIAGLTPPVLARFDEIFCDATTAVRSIKSYLETQIPFPYVHILTFIVVANNILIAVKAGTLIGNCVGPGGYPDGTIITVELIHVILVPFIYHSFLTMGFELANPFTNDENACSFPIYSYCVYCREMEIACIDAADKPPSTVVEGLSDP